MNPIQTKRLTLRPITLNDTKGPYLNWMNDSEVNRFLESRFQVQTPETLTNFIKGLSPDSNVFLAICLKDGTHIGNIKLGPIQKTHLRGEIGIVIGEKKHWGKGYASEAIEAVTKFAFEELKLEKVTAGAYSENFGSLSAFKKAGFQQEAVLKNQYKNGDQWMDEVRMACFRDV